jgi:hypothetical protein
MGWALIDQPLLSMCAFSYDEAAKKVAGDDVIERGSNHKLAAKVWDLNGRSRQRAVPATTDDGVSFSTSVQCRASLLEELGVGVTLR